MSGAHLKGTHEVVTKGVDLTVLVPMLPTALIFVPLHC